MEIRSTQSQALHSWKRFTRVMRRGWRLANLWTSWSWSSWVTSCLWHCIKASRTRRSPPMVAPRKVLRRRSWLKPRPPFIARHREHSQTLQDSMDIRVEILPAQLRLIDQSGNNSGKNNFVNVTFRNRLQILVRDAIKQNQPCGWTLEK